MTVTINGTTGMTIPNGVFADSSGNVGIGTSSPKNPLDVNGNICLVPYYGTFNANSYYSGGWKYIGNGPSWGIGNNFGGSSNGVTVGLAANNVSGAGAALTYAVVLDIDSSANLKFNSGYGSVATAYGCRAWANFAGNGSASANATINASGNISTIFKTANSDFTFNFASAMPDANYAASGTGQADTGGAEGTGNVYCSIKRNAGALSASSARLAYYSASGSAVNSPLLTAQFVR